MPIKESWARTSGVRGPGACRYALISVWEMEGARVVYDAQTLKKVRHQSLSLEKAN